MDTLSFSSSPTLTTSAILTPTTLPLAPPAEEPPIQAAINLDLALPLGIHIFQEMGYLPGGSNPYPYYADPPPYANPYHQIDLLPII
jgi:hypothetical protein